MELVAVEIAPARVKIPVELLARLWAVYEAVPPVKCKGLCQSDCSNVPIFPLEALYLIERHGARVEFAEHRGGTLMPTLGRNKSCQFLDAGGRCSIYEDRPLVCRQFGHGIASLSCRFGCGPHPETLTFQEFLRESVTVGMLGMTGRNFANTTPKQFWFLLERQIADLALVAVMDDGTRAEAEADFTFDDDDPGDVPGRAWEE